MTNDKEFIKEALHEMIRYYSNWNYMSAQDKRNVGCTKAQLRKKIAEYKTALTK